MSKFGKMDLELIFKKWALYNAVKYNGKANLQPVIAKVIGEYPEIRKNIKEYIPKIKEIIDEVNSLSLEEQRKLLQQIAPELLEEKKTEFKLELPPLKNAEEGNVITRFAPAPTGYLHIGHARPILINYLYAKKYNGKFILRIDDTDPKVKRPLPEAYERIVEDVSWLIQDKPDEIIIQSERLEIYYEYARKLIEKGYAYVDLCSPEEISKNRSEGKACKHREQTPEENLELFEKMLNWEFDEEQAVLRIKTDINHPNPSVRDWIAFRIVNTEKYPHPRVGSKYCVWSTYNFACAIDDHLTGITHIFRMKEHEINTVKQSYIYKYFGWKEPNIISFGALKVPHKSEIRKMIEEGKLSGWCDPFVHTLCGLRKRGILPEAIKNYIIEIGPGSVDIIVSWDKIFSYNRDLIDIKSPRYFMIKNPVELVVKNAPEREVKIRKHPNVDLGFRILKIGEKYLIEKEDAERMETGKVYRLMELLNFKVLEKTENRIIAEYVDDNLETAKNYKAKIIHWLSNDPSQTVEIVIWDENGFYDALSEKNIGELREGQTVQFERYFFAKLDDKEQKLFIYMHK